MKPATMAYFEFGTILRVDSSEALEDIKKLFRAYADWLPIDISYQGFEEELAELPGKYDPPAGVLYLARSGEGAAIGCVAMRPMPKSGDCEMKRLFVVPKARGLGVGKAMIDTVIDAAFRAGYQRMLLDTLPSMSGAIALYRSAGFKEIPAYYETPVVETVFFEKTL